MPNSDENELYTVYEIKKEIKRVSELVGLDNGYLKAKIRYHFDVNGDMSFTIDDRLDLSLNEENFIELDKVEFVSYLISRLNNYYDKEYNIVDIKGI